MVRLFGKDLRLTGGDSEVGLRDLEDLGVVQFAIIGTVAVRLEPDNLSVFAVASMIRSGQTCGVSRFTSVLDPHVSAQAAPAWHLED